MAEDQTQESTVPFVDISYHSNHHQILPRDFIQTLAVELTHSIAKATGGKPEEIRVDARPFSPFAQNQPLVSIRISIKRKRGRTVKWLEQVVRETIHMVGNLLLHHADDPQNHCNNFDAIMARGDIHVTVGLTTRRWGSLNDAAQPL